MLYSPGTHQPWLRDWDGDELSWDTSRGACAEPLGSAAGWRSPELSRISTRSRQVPSCKETPVTGRSVTSGRNESPDRSLTGVQPGPVTPP